MRRFGIFATLFSASIIASAQAGPSGRFDLAGPKVEIQVTRAGKMLPIASVPNLLPGDKLWLHPDLPPTQSVNYLLVVVFLRGTTNPPPDNWFIKIETWNHKVREEGFTVTVPEEAQQAILFLAPETGGDFSTLRSAVRGRPGIFVRASQDLAEAGFEQARIEKYLASMQQVPPGDAKQLATHSALLARTLNLKPNEECFKRPVDQQYNCLTQTGAQTLLDDGHGQSVASMLTSGPNSDFISAASYTQMAGGGLYSAYVGAIVDLIRITSGLHTAKYQYIPAIAFPEQEKLNLRLNTPPSFHDPKSVIVIGLPAIQPSVTPPLRPADPNYVTCLLRPSVVLPVEGAPLVFSTSFAHDMVLHIDSTPAEDIPLVPNAFRGGLVLAPSSPRRALPSHSAEATALSPNSASATPSTEKIAAASDGTVTGTIKGSWGFDDFTGPTLKLQNVPGKGWKIDDNDPMIAGREGHFLLSSMGSACVQGITVQGSGGKVIEGQWKRTDRPNVIDVSVPLKFSDPGAVHIAIQQFGVEHPDLIAAQTFSEPAKLESLQLHVGDSSATLIGNNLDQVQQLSLSGVTFLPDADPGTPTTENSPLRLALPSGIAPPKLRVGDKLTAQFTLKDGRHLTLPLQVLPPRPVVTLLSKSTGHPTDSPIHLTAPDDLPVTQQITFSLKSATPFSRTSSIEVANSDESLHTSLNVSKGLVLQNPHTIVATLDPLEAFGTSAFGPLRFRVVAPDGTTGDWQPLATLVRLPELLNIRCTTDVTVACTLNGSNLYLVDSVSSDASFSGPATVPEGYVGDTLSVSHPLNTPATLSSTRPANATLYLRLRDDPSATDTVTLPILPQAADGIHAKEAQSRQPLSPPLP